MKMTGNIAMCLWKQKRWDDSISTLEEVLMVRVCAYTCDLIVSCHRDTNLIIGTPSNAILLVFFSKGSRIRSG